MANETRHSSTSGNLAFEAPTGAVNGSNTSFTVVHTPIMVIIDNMIYRSPNGYTFNAGTITVSRSPVYEIFTIY